MTLKTKLYVALVCLSGLFGIAYTVHVWDTRDPLRFCCYFLITILASGLKMRLPGITGTMSANFPFILIGIVEMGLSETVALGCIGTLVQCAWKPKQGFRPTQAIFSNSAVIISTILTYHFYHLQAAQSWSYPTPVCLLGASILFFLLNTTIVAGVIALTEGKALVKTWHSCYFWSFPFYLIGATIAWVFNMISTQVRWDEAVLVVPVVYFIYRAYRIYLRRLEVEKKHVEEMAGLHLRTIEALALAIEAKDHNTHEHLQRVRTYAVEIAKELHLSEPELEALRAAALLHDIGKLAVPEHIISKPGKLTLEEFEKMKIHPVVGAEILERVQFPCPVVPIVRAHHEKWDGTGYPAGLKGEEIPIGARILSAVDCLDALASERQYRRALPLDEAMEYVQSLSGKSFDPAVISILKRRYVELEQMAKARAVNQPTLSKDVRIERGAAPEAGFEKPKERPAKAVKGDFLSSIAEARQEVRLLFELTQDLGSSLSLDETLSVVAVRLKRLIPYDSIAVYMLRDGRLVPEYVNGENFRLLSSLQIPAGQGLSGWVAENGKPILNGSPSVECGYLNDPKVFSTLRSAVAVPLEGAGSLLGVLTLYRLEKDAFSKDHVRILLAISPKVSLAIENALKFRQVESSATTDYLTNLPNARSLFLRLETELSRCQRVRQPLAVLVCDLDGFKQVNDRFGHMEGNKVLRRIGDVLKANCRQYDYVARMGGDEFVLILPGSDHRTLLHRIRDLRELVGRTGVESGADFLSLSVGHAVYPEDGEDAEQLLAEADRRMYKAKQASRSVRALQAHTEELAVAV